MSGVAGGNRIDKADVKATFEKYTKQILEKIPGFKKATLSGSVKVGSKPDYGDLDLVTWFEGDDKKEVKQRIIQTVTAMPDSVIVPFKSEKYTGKKYYNSGEIITVLYPIEGKQDEFIQVDNIIALSEEEHGFKNNFLDLPAEIQGLILGLTKVILLEEDPNQVFNRLGIKNLPPLGENEEYEFNLSSVKLSLRKVRLDNFKEVGREELWDSTDWNQITKLFVNFNIDSTFEDLLKDIKTKVKNPRSRNRIKGIFNSMITVKSGEVGTPKGDNKERAIKDVNTLLENQGQVVALYAGGFKPPHKAHFENAKILSQQADKLIIFVGPKVREGIKITAQQSKDIWDIYAKYLPTKVEVVISAITPVKDIYDWVDINQPNVSKIITGAMMDEMKKFSYFIKNKDKYPKVEIIQLPVIVSKEDDKFSATEIRSSKEYLVSGKWIPTIVSNQDKQEIIDIVTYQAKASIEDKIAQAIDEVLQSFEPDSFKEPYFDTGKFNLDKPLSKNFLDVMGEISLSNTNDIQIQGDTTGGAFKVGDKRYTYEIKNIKNPYNDGGTFYNIGFFPEERRQDTPTSDTSPKDYLKILSTMYRIITDFTEKNQPDYLGIASMNNPTGKEYHTVYSNLTDNKANRIPGYFRKDSNLTFSTPQGRGRMIVMKRKTESPSVEEGSSGTAIRPHSIVRSADRAKLVGIFNQIRNTIPESEFEIVFNQDHITIKNRDKDSNPGFDYTPYMASILEYMIDKGEKILPLPEIKIKKDIAESADFFGKTAHYSPQTNEIVLYVEGRHPKDVMRSFAHEMIHHKQNLEGKLKNIQTDNTNQDDYLLEIEKQAYLEGNILFRNWEDSVKN